MACMEENRTELDREGGATALGADTVATDRAATDATALGADTVATDRAATDRAATDATATDAVTTDAVTTEASVGSDSEITGTAREGGATASADIPEAEGELGATDAVGVEEGLSSARERIERAHRAAEAAEVLRRRRSEEMERAARERAEESTRAAREDERKARKIEEERLAALSYAEDYRRRLREQRGDRDSALRDRESREAVEEQRQRARAEAERAMAEELEEAKRRSERTEQLLSRIRTQVNVGSVGGRDEKTAGFDSAFDTSAEAKKDRSTDTCGSSLGASTEGGTDPRERTDTAAEASSIIDEASDRSTDTCGSSAFVSTEAEGGIVPRERTETVESDSAWDSAGESTVNTTDTSLAEDDGIICIDLGTEAHLLHIGGEVVGEIPLGNSTDRADRVQESGTRVAVSRENGRRESVGAPISDMSRATGEEQLAFITRDDKADRTRDLENALSYDMAARREAIIKDKSQRDSLLDYHRSSADSSQGAEDLTEELPVDVSHELEARDAAMPDEVALTAKLSRKEQKRLRKAEKQKEADELLAFLDSVKEEAGLKKATEEEFIPSATADTTAVDRNEACVRERKRDREHRRFRQKEARRVEKEDMAALLALEQEDTKRKQEKSEEEEPSTAPLSVSIGDIKALRRTVKAQRKRDAELIRLRYRRKLRDLELKSEASEMSFSELVGKEKEEHAHTVTTHRAKTRELQRALKLEEADNDRYYKLILTDLDTVRLSRKADRSALKEIRDTVTELLCRRDELNRRLIELYTGISEGKRAKGGEEARADAERKGRRREYNRLKRTDAKIRKKRVSYDLRKGIYELMDERVSLAGSFERVEYVLKHEKPQGAQRKQLRREYKRLRGALRDNEYQLQRILKRGIRRADERNASRRSGMVGWILLLLLCGGIAAVYFFREPIFAFLSDLISGLMP